MTLAYHQPICLLDFRATLGEGPVWVASEGAFYFVDILEHRVYRYILKTGELQGWDAPNRTGFLLPVDDDTFLAGLPDGLHRFDPQKGHFSHTCTVEPDAPGNRLNDGCVDAQGRLWFGTMDDGEERDSGALYRVEMHKGELSVSHWDSGYTVSNGPALSPCGNILYACDSPHRHIYAYDVDAQGNLANKRIFVTFTKGYPDGVVVDSQGNIWCGTWDGGQITRFRSDGTEMEPIALPVSNVTKVAFGGEDNCTVFVTTARKGLTPEMLRREPQAGGIFAFRTDIPGQTQHSFRLSV